MDTFESFEIRQTTVESLIMAAMFQPFKFSGLLEYFRNLIPHQIQHRLEIFQETKDSIQSHKSQEIRMKHSP